jgi:hypothetical protein
MLQSLGQVAICLQTHPEPRRTNSGKLKADRQMRADVVRPAIRNVTRQLPFTQIDQWSLSFPLRGRSLKDVKLSSADMAATSSADKIRDNIAAYAAWIPRTDPVL